MVNGVVLKHYDLGRGKDRWRSWSINMVEINARSFHSVRGKGWIKLLGNGDYVLTPAGRKALEG